MRKTLKIAFCLVMALFFGAEASAVLREVMKPPEIRNWERTGDLRFDRPVTEDYARRINQEVRTRIAREDMLRRYNGPAIVPLLGSAVGFFAGMLFDPLLLLIEAAAFALTWGVSSVVERRQQVRTSRGF
jgi:hypothetical protein